jgi:hypothetical protein
MISRKRSARSRRRHPALRILLESLESRIALSTLPTYYTVNLLSDTGASSGTDATTGDPAGDLLWAVTQANSNTNPAGSLINFDPNVFATSQTITLSSTLELDESAGPEVITGPGSGLLSIDGDGKVTVFDVEEGVTASLSGLTITGGSTSVYGGGVYCYKGTVNLTACTITDNSAAEQGGGLTSDQGTMTLTDCTVSGNSAGSGSGGGLTGYNVTLTSCTISGNSAGGTGGGLNVYGMTLTDCTITGNSAGASGGGLYGVGTLTGCTVSGNFSAGGSGGLFVADGNNLNAPAVTTLTDTIVAGNTSASGADDIDIGQFLTTITGSYNIISTGAPNSLSATNHNILNVADPGLGPLANNGGPTETMALLPGSPAIGAGTAVSGVGADQRGLPLDNPPDIGAYQTQAAPVSLTVDSISAVAPATRNSPVTSVSVTLNEPAAMGGFTASALVLTDNAGPNLINGSVTVTLVSGATYEISGLSSITRADGSYELTINAADIHGASGTAGSGTKSISWLMDTTAPTSTVTALPAQTTSTSFTVAVMASDPAEADGASASEVASIAIYASVNGGPYTLFTTATPANPTVTFTGQVGDSFAFYSIATDKAGNVQPVPTAAQAVTAVISPPSPTQTVVVGEQPVFKRKLNNKGKPVGKATLAGLMLQFGTQLDQTTAANSANYQLATVTTKKVKKKKIKVLQSITKFNVSYLEASDTVEITFGSPETFPTGGQITVLGGLTTATGGTLTGNAVYTISKGGKGIVPA